MEKKKKMPSVKARISVFLEGLEGVKSELRNDLKDEDFECR